MSLAIGSEVLVLLDGGNVDMLGVVLEDGPDGAVVRLENGRTIRETNPRVADIVCMQTYWEDMLASPELDEMF